MITNCGIPIVLMTSLYANWIIESEQWILRQQIKVAQKDTCSMQKKKKERKKSKTSSCKQEMLLQNLAS